MSITKKKIIRFTLQTLLGTRQAPLMMLASLLFTITSCNSPKKISAENQRTQTIVSAARSYIGTPYRYGGTTRSGMDCSALVVRSFEQAKVPVPRTSGEQVKLGKAVGIYDLKPGDLVFFSAKKNRRKITHVGIVTAIKGKDNVSFIHASTKLGVIENNLMSDYYRGIFVKARRPL